jgi:flagellar basal-body rod protein FlgG
MFRSLYTAATGMYAQELNMDQIADDLANTNTVGYKKGRINFEDLMYTTMAEPGAMGAYGDAIPASSQVGSGVRVESLQKIFTPGQYEHTGNPLDLAIYGDGFFKVRLEDGSVGYTRAGNITLDPKGHLVSGGHPLWGVKIPTRATGIEVEQDGTIKAFVNNQNQRVKVGQITLVRFLNPSGLRMVGNVFVETPVSGTKVEDKPGKDGLGIIKSGYLEKSNVNVVQEMMEIVAAQRAYEFNTKAVTTADEMMRMTTQLKPQG